MKFGKVKNPGEIDFKLPEDHPDTKQVLNRHQNNGDSFDVYVGCAKWNRQELKGFYPRGTKDELSYYATQFNSIELNATFYRSPTMEQTETWALKTPEGFKFFPKVPNRISHIKWLNDVEDSTIYFCESLAGFGSKLGMVFLQMRDNFKPKYMDRVQQFLELFPRKVPLAIEVRNTEWFTSSEHFEEYSSLLKEHNRANIIVDTAGRRDLLHMRLTSDSAFIRYVGANHESDYSRLDDWVERIAEWRSQGLKNLYFFVHQNEEQESPRLSAYFIKKLNENAGTTLKVPEIADNPLGL